MAVLTVTTTAPQDVIVAAAFGRRLGLPGDATGPQVKAEVIRLIVEICRDYQYRQAADAIVVTPIAPT